MEDDSEFNERFGGIEVYRPRNFGKLKLRIESEAHLRSAFSPGIYSEPEEINKILLHQFAFYSKKFEEIIPKLASHNFIEFVLFQFDQASVIEDKYKHGQLSEPEASRWRKLGSIFRRAVKYLAERIVLLQPDETPDSPEEFLRSLLDEIWIAAEEMVDLYLVSDQTFMVFPEHTTFEIYPEGSFDLWSIDVQKECDIQEAVRRDTTNQRSVIGADASFIIDISIHNQIIGNALKETIGISYQEVINLLIIVIRDSMPAPEERFPVLFLHRSNLVETLHQYTKLPREAIEIVLDSFTIRKVDMESEGRAVWKPKQEYRSLRRGFFEMPHPTGTHLAFARSMALESLNQLARNVVFRQIPSEWKSQTVDAAIASLSNQSGSWFETVVEKNLKLIGFIGLRSVKKQIGSQDNAIRIPREVGEIDFLGYSESEKIILIAECKMVQGGFEGKFFRDDIKDFITSKKSYLKKYSRKVKWLQENMDIVINALNSTRLYSAPIQPLAIATAIITYYPTIVQCFIEEYPCVSITNLMLDYKEKGEWPYTKGLFRNQ
ncbi:hypothetical protein QUA56_28620 [Microcoleus sp. N3A4]|uniref:hypothetical protein n=1 Tax=Microcoleus sp. N3A4 TaxID=3055379 RepID=UPI002FD38056